MTVHTQTQKTCVYSKYKIDICGQWKKEKLIITTEKLKSIVPDLIVMGKEKVDYEYVPILFTH